MSVFAVLLLRYLIDLNMLSVFAVLLLRYLIDLNMLYVFAVLLLCLCCSSALFLLFFCLDIKCVT